MNHGLRSVVVTTLLPAARGASASPGLLLRPFCCHLCGSEIESASTGPLNLFLRGGSDMRFKAIFAALFVCLASAAVCLADDAFSGTWKLNEAKSKLSAGMNKNTTVTYAVSGDSVKVTLDGVAPDGK